MPVSVTMPALGESVTEGTVTRWLKQEGEQVQADEPLLEVSTDKVDTEIPSPASGILTRIVVSEDETVDVGTELAVIGDAADSDGGGGSDSDAAADDDAQSDEAAGSDDESEEAAESDDAAGTDDGDSVDGDAASGDAADGDAADGDAGDGDAADEAVQEAAGAEQADQPSEPAQASDGSRGSESGSDAGSGDSAKSGSAKSGKSAGGTSITMPALGESVTEGTVTRWLKNVGDDVAVDEPLLEVSTDKVDTEIPSPVAGTLLEITVNEDETVEVGAQLATIGTASGGDEQDAGEQSSADSPPEQSADESADEPAEEPVQDAPKDEKPKEEKPKEEKPKEEKPTEEKPKDAVPATKPAAQSAGDAGGSAAYVTPLVRKLAAEQGVDLSVVRGTGVGGRIRKQDVLAAAKPAAAEPAAAEPAAAVSTGVAPPAAKASAPDPAAQALRGKTEKLSRLRTVIAKRMVESLQISAQLTTVVEVDITEISRLRARVKADFESREGVKLSFLPFFALAVVEALKAHPKVNSSIDMDAGTVTYHDSENLGIAVDTERGLLVPVIHGAGDLNLGGISRKIADLADRTRRNKITPDELSGGTFTLTNTGSRGALFDTPIINQPQSAILGTGTVVKRPVVIDHPDLGEIVTVRSMIYLALSYDHRIVDGADAARFLVSMKQRLEAGDFESALGLG